MMPFSTTDFLVIAGWSLIMSELKSMQSEKVASGLWFAVFLLNVIAAYI